MRRAVAPLLLALPIVSPLVAQSAATFGPTTWYSRMYVFGHSHSNIGRVHRWRSDGGCVSRLAVGLQVAPSKGGERHWPEPRVRGERRGHG